ncbi:MAG: bifunctional precorrin-2 dehydrogenase/sirohydrochlorin ferrochelatase [Synergistaceae bacterium]|nr:bifunctional precorrin-2 dehydrogenase/sirohydrochlorin ferrochelatase [Synergistaceae bacterium]
MNSYPFFPMMINLIGKKVLVIGGGKVASRRADTLIRCGAEVKAVSEKFSDDFPKEALRIIKSFTPDDITDDLSLIVSATDNRETNHLVYRTAKAKLIPVNISDCQEECDFFFPSMINSGTVAVSVCSAGTSSILTRRLSDRLRKVWHTWIADENNTKIR